MNLHSTDPTACAIEDCTHPARAKGLCARHYYRAHAKYRRTPARTPIVEEHDPIDIDCHCTPPATPERCTLRGAIVIPGAYQCTRCYRRIA